MTYVDMVENVVLGLLRSSRERNWGLHLHAIKSMIPWCFAYDKVNYARYLSAYFAEMTNLPEKIQTFMRHSRPGNSQFRFPATTLLD